MIAVLCPSRGRPNLFKSAYQSTLDHASNPDNIFFALRIDNDDNYLNSYIPILRKQDEIVIGAKTTTSVAHLAEELYDRFNNHDIYVCLNDDMICRTQNWDKQLVDHFDQLPGKIGTVRLGDGHNIQANVFAQTIQWIEALGYMLPKELSWGEDTYLNDLGLALRIAGYEKHYADRTDIVFEHFHPHFGTRAQDATDRANNERHPHWLEQYNKRLKGIPEDVQKLINAIRHQTDTSILS